MNRLRTPTLLIVTACLSFAPHCTRAAEAKPDTAANPVIIQAGPDWIPLKPELEIEPGSALDFTHMGFTDAPAGKHGRVITRPDGQFAFAHSPGIPRRFYGINLCFGAHYLEDDEPNRLAQRLVRLGYNTVRIHHHERDLVDRQSPTTQPNPSRLAQFDQLTAALIQHGLYLTTDLYVSRSVPWREIGIDRDGRVPMDTFKILVPVHAGAMDNWKEFTRNLLTHVNPHTGRSYADEPALAWLSMINEGNFGNFFRDLRTFPEWTLAWNRWLARQYPTRTALADAWGATLSPDEDPARHSVALPENLSGRDLRTRDCIAFLSHTEFQMVEEMKRFLRDELGCHALVSNANSWTYFTTDQAARLAYDYVDDHFYVDHPQFLEQSWRLPSRCPNTSPLADGATGGRSKSFTRLLDRPFTITEYNYSGPGRFRGVGGILTGAMGALQNWNGLWRFAYSHSREAMFKPSRMGYFDLASDPLSQAAERASLMLFLRGDLQPAPHSVAFAMTTADLHQPADRIPRLAPNWHWLAWIARVGTLVLEDPTLPTDHHTLIPLGWQTPPSAYDAVKTLAVEPYSVTPDQLWSQLRQRGIVPPTNPTDPARRLYQSSTGQITVDSPADRLVLDTPRTAGGYAPINVTVQAPEGGVQFTPRTSDATLWVSALDALPIRSSHRLLLTHLTDLQNTDIRYREPERQTLLDWGRLPHLVRAGQAEVAVDLNEPTHYTVWALDPGGRRLARLPTTVEGQSLKFTVDVAAAPDAGARMLYEITR
jgi:hypothetical protein